MVPWRGHISNDPLKIKGYSNRSREFAALRGERRWVGKLCDLCRCEGLIGHGELFLFMLGLFCWMLEFGDNAPLPSCLRTWNTVLSF